MNSALDVSAMSNIFDGLALGISERIINTLLFKQ